MHWTIVILFTLSLGTARDSGEECRPPKGRPGCVCETERGVIDLTSIARNNLEPYFDKVQDPAGYEYMFNPCYPLVCNNDRSTAVCQYTHDSDHQYESCGKTTDEVMLKDDGHYLLQYTGGDDGRLSQVLLICNKSAEVPTLKADGAAAGTMTYIFYLETKCACPGVCDYQAKTRKKANAQIHSGYAGFSFLALLLVGVVGYFTVGMIISKFHLHKDGTDIIPHKDFWLGFADLVKDGCVFTFSPICNKKKTIMTGYEKL